MGGQMGMAGGGGGGSQYGQQQQYDPWQQQASYLPQQQMYDQGAQQNMLGSMGSAYGSAAQNQGGWGQGQWQPPQQWQGQLGQPQAMPSSAGALLGAQPGFSNMRGEGSLSNWWNNAAPWQQEMFPQYGPDQQLTDLSGGVNTLMMKPGGMPSSQGPNIGTVGNTIADMGQPGRGQEGGGTIQAGVGGPGGDPTPQPNPFDVYQARELRGIE